MRLQSLSDSDLWFHGTDRAKMIKIAHDGFKVGDGIMKSGGSDFPILYPDRTYIASELGTAIDYTYQFSYNPAVLVLKWVGSDFKHDEDEAHLPELEKKNLAVFPSDLTVVAGFSIPGPSFFGIERGGEEMDWSKGEKGQQVYQLTGQDALTWLNRSGKRII